MSGGIGKLGQQWGKVDANNALVVSLVGGMTGDIVTATEAFILGAATTAGIRMDLESGVLAVREGDDSAYGALSTGAIKVNAQTPGVTTAQLYSPNGADLYYNGVQLAASTAGDITGSGATAQLPVFTGANAVAGNAALTYDGTTFTVGAMLDATRVSVTGTTAGAVAIAGDYYSHVLLAVGYNGTSPLNEPHQVGVYSAIVANSASATGVTGSAATDGYSIGFETAIGTDAGGTVPWVVGYSIGSISKGVGDTIVRTTGIAGIEETAGTHNAFFAPADSTFTGNWFVYYNGSRPSFLGTGALTLGEEVYRNVDDDFLRVSGGNAAGTGANLLLFGSTHATNPNQMILTGSGGITLTGATGITGATTITGALTYTGTGIVGSDMHRSIDTDFLRVSGGDGAGTGANLILFGSTHATNPNQMSISATGGVLIGNTSNLFVGGSAARSTTAGTNQVILTNGTAPVGTLANGVSFYSTAGEARVMDAAGNATLLSPHDHDTNEWIYWSKNTVTGQVLRVDMERLMRRLDQEFGGGFITESVE